jgi:predicted amidohydrolase YtcJ
MHLRLFLCVAATVQLAFLALPVGKAAEPPADLVVTGAKVATMDPARPVASAIAVRGDRIVAVGDDAEIAALAGPGTRRLDAGGRRVVPGFIEGHGHLMALGEALATLDLRGARDFDAIVEQVRDAAARAEPGTWIVGTGWHQEKWASLPGDAVAGVPRNATLDAAAPRNPVMLEHASGHGVLVNAVALRSAGIRDDTPSPAGGQITRDEGGRATGWLIDTAAEPVHAARAQAFSSLPFEVQRRELVARVQRAGQAALAKGVTTFHDAGTPFATIDLYRALADRGELPLRLYVMVGGESNESLQQNLARYRTIGHGGGFLTVRAIKRMADGALGSRSAWLLEPYSDDASSTGLVVDSVATISATAELALIRGYQLNTHAIGDRANREILDLYERVQRAHPGSRDLRWRIEHAQHLHPDEVPRFARLGVIASMQGVHATSDGPWVPKRLGEPRAGERTYVWRSLHDAGAIITNGTDVPVEDIDPLASFRASVTREMADGRRFHPEQCLTRQEALESYTVNNAFAAFEEDIKGTVAPGKLADFVVLDRDILEVPDAELAQARVLHTVLAGRVVFSRNTGTVR